MRTNLPAALLLCLAAVACDEPAAPTTTPTTALRVINAADGPVDVLVDGQTLLRRLAPGAVSARIGVTADQHAVQLRQASASTTSASVAVTASTGRTALLYARSVGGSLAATALSDTGAAPVAGKSKLRVVHLAANAPAIDVWRTQPDYTTPIRVMFPFAYLAESNYMQSDPGAWEVTVTREGEAAPVLATSGPITVADGGVRTVVLLDAPNGGIKVEPVDER
jgi:hypothetical protein